jgi:ABC-type transporter Mla MlaB component
MSEGKGAGMYGDVPDNRLEISGSVDDLNARLVLRGVLTTRTVETIDRYLAELKRQDIREVEIDLQGLTRLDSSGVALLLRVHYRAPEYGWRVSMVAPPDHLRWQLERLGVASRLPFVSA